MSKSIVFPGQGSQKIGMGKELFDAFPSARHVFNEVNDALGQDLTKIIFEGDPATLTLTENAQPALMAVSMAVVEVLRQEFNISVSKFSSAAGHSLGEYSALAALGVMSIADAAKLLRIRGDSMQAAVPVGVGAMAAILGLDAVAVEEIAHAAAEGEICTLANDNAPGQAVVSGDKAAVERAMVLAKDKGAKRSILLPVSAPFHCSLMAPAAKAMDAALADVEFGSPKIPFIANVTADYEDDPALIKKYLVEQVTGRVRWQESIRKMGASGVEEIIELGAGKVLTGLTKRIQPDIVGVSLNTPEALEAFAKTF